ncbi:MAG: succinate dehydrogenase cytochrome b558 subunit [Planctomycetes bacterium]|nr:succinate dehydrogenase cytochrome b558 subunit [Planctomycetota bacterium]
MTDTGPHGSFLVRHDFLIRRLHSLSGLVPVGAYMVVHLLVNSSILASTTIFQDNVDRIHSVGPLALQVIEWVFIFIPILFHAIFGVVIIAGGVPNTGEYRHGSNIRYTLQRATGIIAFFFIAWHLWHMHHYFEPLGGGNFQPEHASSSAAEALSTLPVKIGYTVGVLACCFHLANGMWTMGITWGVWTSPRAQKHASTVCAVFGIGLACVGLSAMSGFGDVDIKATREMENRKIQVDKYIKGEEELPTHKHDDADDEPGG